MFVCQEKSVVVLYDRHLCHGTILKRFLFKEQNMDNEGDENLKLSVLTKQQCSLPIFPPDFGKLEENFYARQVLIHTDAPFN